MRFHRKILSRLDLANIKTKCMDGLDVYILSRGELTQGNKECVPSWTTKCFRNVELTQRKIQKAQALKVEIDSESSLLALERLILDALQDKDLMNSRADDSLRVTLHRCLNYVLTGLNEDVDATDQHHMTY